MADPIPWSSWLRLAAWLGVAPHNFWRLGLREWRALIGASEAQSMSRARFNALAQDFPDLEV
jgi:hypothetical protein